MFNFHLQEVLELFASDEKFLLIGYSFGSLLSLQISKALESKGLTGNVVMIDGSPLFFRKFTDNVAKVVTSEENGQNEILVTLIRIDFPGEDNQEVIKNIFSVSDWNLKLDVFMKFHESKLNFKRIDSRDYITAIMERFKMANDLQLDSFPRLEKSKISIVQPSDLLVVDIDETYGLQENSSFSVETLKITGNHSSILETNDLFEFINKLE